MLKARRKEHVEQGKFPEPREGLPEDPRPFIGAQHLIASAAVQEQLSARCLVAVVGRAGSGKSTVCRRAANSRWARQWFLHDEDGHPHHRRFWVDLEDASPGADTEQHVALALGRPNFDEALARLGSGKPSLLILDNADLAFGEVEGQVDKNDTLARLVGCVERGASIVITRRTIAGFDVGRPWSDVIEVSGFSGIDEARELFDQLAPRHASDLRVGDVVAACDRLPLAVNLLGKMAAGADLELARLRVGPNSEGVGGLDFAVEVAAAMLDPEDRQLWGSLSLLPAGLGSDDISEVFAAAPNARERTIKLFEGGVAHRCEAGVRIPAPLRLAGSAANLDAAAISELWRSYLRRAQAVVGPVPDWATVPGGRTGTDSSTTASLRAKDRAGRTDRAPQPDRTNTKTVNAWLVRQVPNLRRLTSQPSVPEGALDVGCAGLLAHRSGLVADAVDQVLVRLIDAGMGTPAHPSDPAHGPLAPRNEPTDLAVRIAAELEDQRRFGTAVLVTAVVADRHRRAGRIKGEAEALCQMGRCERFLGRYQDAEVHISEAHQHFEKLNDGVGQGSALFELGQVDLDLGLLDDAEIHLGEALTLFAANGRPVGEANTNLELVRVDLARGRPDSAERRLGDALDRYEEAGDRLGFANACLQLGQVELARGHLDGAERRFGGALAGYEQVGDKVGVANACLQMGQIDVVRGRPEQAAQRLHQALAAYRHQGDRIGRANASLLLGQVHLGQGELEEADQQLQAAQRAYDEIGDRIGSANSRHLEAMLREAQGKGSQAMALYGDAARLYRSLGRTSSAAWSLVGAARTCTGKAERRGYAADAVQLLNEAGLADAAAQLTAQFAEPAPSSALSSPPPQDPDTDFSLDPKWKQELVAVAQASSDSVDGDGVEIWSPQWPSGHDAVESAPLGEWTSRWRARQAAIEAEAGVQAEPVAATPPAATPPAATPAARPAAAPVARPATGEATGPAAAPVARPAAGPATGAATGPAAAPAARPATSRVVKPVASPTGKPATGKSATGRVVKQMASPTAKPPTGARAAPTVPTPGGGASRPGSKQNADLTATSAPLRWSATPAKPATEDVAVPADGLQHADDDAATSSDLTLFGDIIAPKPRRRWGRRKDE
ncbi:MAG: hypothetical protein QOF30_3100 [Acidimicrobiaceae bacterium]|nr:hypothetical protein [Acidimicrobiaceae bacterium]